MKNTEKSSRAPKLGKMDFLFKLRKRSKYYIIIPITLYVLLYICTIIAARSGAVMTIGENTLPMSAFAGVFSSFSNICLVTMVLFHKKTGFITALLIIVLQFPILIFQGVASNSVISM